eukprot:TRINITY_DN9844_c1_g1_i1.p1 TRINITY_DN9844_c1_g1~~TRINITY_DN9844_c1_g1_i1.p1  ORF type:complete len:104 (-),score=6.14 TRINITY_DN9844_c1_g1_i1:194-505(-)
MYVQVRKLYLKPKLGSSVYINVCMTVQGRTIYPKPKLELSSFIIKPVYLAVKLKLSPYSAHLRPQFYYYSASLSILPYTVFFEIFGLTKVAHLDVPSILSISS